MLRDRPSEIDKILDSRVFDRVWDTAYEEMPSTTWDAGCIASRGIREQIAIGEPLGSIGNVEIPRLAR